jgi:radical SAM protein with 4Fe4S-binding SPASM domain
MRVSISLDGRDRASHDAFRGGAGAFDAALAAARTFREAGLPFQINTTVTRLNVDGLDGLYALVREIGAAAWHVFLLVPVGRGEGLKGEELNAAMYEEVLNRLYERETEEKIEMKITCAPHYYRIVKERGGTPKGAGCLAGKAFLFISHRGIAQPCGYLEVACGDVRKDGVRQVWEHSPELGILRDLRSYKGKCAACRYLAACGGCRARAYQLKGDMLEAEPYCSYGGH